MSLWAHADTDFHGDAYSDGDTNTNVYSHSDGNLYSHSNAYSNINTDGYADCDSYVDSNAHTYFKVCSDAAASPYPSAATVTHDAAIHVYDDAGNVIETHEQKGDFSDF